MVQVGSGAISYADLQDEARYWRLAEVADDRMERLFFALLDRRILLAALGDLPPAPEDLDRAHRTAEATITRFEQRYGGVEGFHAVLLAYDWDLMRLRAFLEARSLENARIRRLIVARLRSARHLALHSEPIRPEPRARPWMEVLRSPALKGARRLIAYLLCLQVAVQVAAPYYSPYMLKQLGLPYGTYMLLIASAYVAKMAALPLLGAWAREVGARKLAWIGTCGIVFASLPWYATSDVGFLLAAQLVAGVFWAAFELASLLLLFEHIPERERTSVITLYNLGNAACFALGSLVGGALLQGLGAGAEAYGVLFLLTSALRALTLLLLRRVEPGRGAELAVPHLHPSAVRPSLGSIEVPEPGSGPEST
ncbi:MAG: MFS transporter [Planctomycetaceae bacterium]|nr:MFS transporter [Planctomycetaceae bacterium]